jgi:hypothetical protein
MHIDGSGIAQAVSRRLPTAVARVRARVRSSWIFGRQRGTWGRFPPSTSVSPAGHSTNCSTLIIIHDPGLVQWPTYQVDSVLPHKKELKKLMYLFRK